MFLRDRSADAHATLDKCVGPLDTHTSYRRYVSGISAFRLPLEAELRPIVWPELFSGYTFQPLADLLVKDMSDLDLAAPQLLPRETSPLTFEGLVGTLYVLEGSALGSRLLYRRAEVLGMTASFGARHLAVQSAPSDQWRSFLTLLEAKPLDMELVLKSADATFKAAEKAFAILDAT
ncbi:biliverdin-producing heme oxygenase [Rhizobium leguminosarum]|nr:biliverdin-producing heme oxygenase [Rhizobium leguminosarum]